MTIQFLRNTNIRINPKDLTFAPIGVVYANTELTVEDDLHQGSTLQGINTYYRDSNGWYYWSGETKIMAERISSQTAPLLSELTEEKIEIVPTLDKSGIEVVVDRVDPIDEQAALNDIQASTENTASQTNKDQVSGSNSVKNTEADPRITQPNKSYLPAWYLPSDSFHDFFWREEEMFGKGTKVAIISDQAFATDGLVGQNGVVIKGFETVRVPPSISLGEKITPAEIIGRRNSSLTGIAPEAEIYLAKVSSDNAPDITSWLSALNWIKKISPEVLLVDAFINWDTPPTRLNQLLHELTKAGTIIFAPIGEGRGRRPINYWPASVDTCIAVGAFDLGGRPMASNQLSSALQILGPGQSKSARATTSPSRGAAAYLAGITVLAHQWVNIHGQHLSVEDWRTQLFAAVHRVTADANSSGPSVGKFNSALLMSGLKNRRP